MQRPRIHVEQPVRGLDGLSRAILLGDDSALLCEWPAP
jgi:hypothetical protein